MEDRISRLLYHHYESMMQGRWACRLDIDKTVSLWECIFWSGRLGI